MKIITTILLFFAAIADAKYAPIHSKETLIEALETVQKEESLWLIGSMAESLEWQIIGQMAQEFPWQTRLKDRQPPTFEEYREIALSRGFTIEHTEVHRELIAASDWRSILPDLGLEATENCAYIDEFRVRCQALQGGVYKQLHMKVTLNHPEPQ